MKNLYAPWRSYYDEKARKSEKNSNGCPLCLEDCASEDQENLVLKRLTYTYIILNKYPYNVGHCMVVPYKHTGSLSALSPEARAELMEATALTNAILEKKLKTDGTNIGINSGGKIAGGSIPDHLHMHIVPRWLGDTTFMVTIADTKPISHSLYTIYTDLKKEFDAHTV